MAQCRHPMDFGVMVYIIVQFKTGRLRKSAIVESFNSESLKSNDYNIIRSVDFRILKIIYI